MYRVHTFSWLFGPEYLFLFSFIAHYLFFFIRFLLTIPNLTSFSNDRMLLQIHNMKNMLVTIVMNVLHAYDICSNITLSVCPSQVSALSKLMDR